MDTTKLKKFSQYARTLLIEQVGTKLNQVLAAESPARREAPKAVSSLESQVKKLGKNQLIEQVAYTWFNRFCALRFMDVNGYNRVQVLSPLPGQFQPEILTEAKSGLLDENFGSPATRRRISDLLNSKLQSSDPQGEAFRLLIVAACNYWHQAMPFMFEKIADDTELLMPDDLLSGNSILSYTREALTAQNCSPENTEESVEVLGWLYQFYISEKKDQVFAGLKKNQKITPENIPAATQLFTPHWIVRYLVENSLGRLWLLNRPHSRLAERMNYYIAPEEPEMDFLKITCPEEIRICDPAAGSGHMLTYAFDLLYAIYEEEGYEASEIPALILRHNLTGVEIDVRASALAAFALAMKAAARLGRRRFLRMEEKPNICVLQNVAFTEGELQDVAAEVGQDLFTDGLRETLGQFEHAKNFGSLIVPKLRDPAETLRVVEARDFGGDLLLKEVQERVVAVLRMAEALSPKYHVVVANPPYLGKGMNESLAAFVKLSFPDSKADLFAVFIERGLQLSKKTGLIGIICMQSWMFLSVFNKLRTKILSRNTILSMAHLGERGFDTIGGSVVSTTAFVLLNKADPDYPGNFLRLTDGKSEEEKASLVRAVINGEAQEVLHHASTKQFDQIPGSPIAYWLSDVGVRAFSSFGRIGDISKPHHGMSTNDNDRFVRKWVEVSADKMGVGYKSISDAMSGGEKWFPYNKGGEFRRWYGNNDNVVNWENDGAEMKHWVVNNPQDPKTTHWSRRIVSSELFFKKGITWSFISSGSLGVRFSDEGFLFDVGGSCIFPPEDKIAPMLACLAARTTKEFLGAVNPTLNFQAGNIASVPIPLDNIPHTRLTQLVGEVVDLSRSDWDAYETSWDFTTLPLLQPDHRGETLADSHATLRAHWQSMTNEMKALEEENNRIFIDAYGLEDELTPEVPIKEITLTCNPAYRYGVKGTETDREARLRADTMAEFLHYAVGCMFGRYSLDKPGLILADAGDTLEQYFEKINKAESEVSFLPDDDAIVPILEGEWFDDDITERFKKFLKACFGEEHYEENLEWLENSLFPTNLEGKKRKSIRDYFLKDFYKDHVQTYKKRPIYWLFSSPKGSFNALVYLHRYTTDTVSLVLNDYLREFTTKLTAKMENLQHLEARADASKKDKADALKEIAKIKKILIELNDWEKDTLFPLAQDPPEIDLDDGVKHNYPLFGKALKKIPGLS